MSEDKNSDANPKNLASTIGKIIFISTRYHHLNTDYKITKIAIIYYRLL